MGGRAAAQAPTSLQYPAVTAAITGQSPIFLSPTVSGNVVSYSISPSLPAGLSFNTNTGVISGTPTATSAAASYTVTATNASGSTTAAFSIQTMNTHFNVAFDTLKFINTPSTVTAIRGTGKNVSDSILYKNVITIGGQQIDCIVTTTAKTNDTIVYYDQEATSGAGFSANLSRFFSPQVYFYGAGKASFTFQFILGNTYVSTANPGTPVYLQNVRVNTYDIDGNGTWNSNQYNEFNGFDSSELGIGAKLTTSYDPTTGQTKFHSNDSVNVVDFANDSTRVRLSYKNMSNFTLSAGADTSGYAYFVFDFSSGAAAFATAVTSTAPSIDLETGKPGVNNDGSTCTGVVNFTGGSGQTNVTTPTDPNLINLTVSFPTASIVNGASEQIVINGATAGGTIALNADPSISNLTLGGIVYSVSGATANGIRTLTITRNTGTLVTANVESLLDAMQYKNVAALPTNGDRAFTVNTRNSVYKSPDAVLTATVGCVSISGNIYHDANGLSDAIVNGNGAQGQFAAGATSGFYAVLTNPANNAVLSTQAIAAGGAYTFGRIDTGDYAVYISNTATPGATISAATYPTGYKSIGENLGASAGNDLSIDGKLFLNVGSVPITAANFGIQVPPTDSDKVYASINNPGGYNYYTIPVGGFKCADVDGSVDSVTITTFPTNTNYLKVGSVVYTNGGTCPPQVSCTAWPGSLKFPYSLVTAGSVAVDPTSAGITSVVITHKVQDNGRLISNNGGTNTTTIGFIVPTPAIAISGYVWNDYNGNGAKSAPEAYTNIAASSQTLYAVLVQNTNTISGSPTVWATSAIAASSSGYSFSAVPPGNAYEVRIVSAASAPAAASAAASITPNLATGWTDVSTSNNGTVYKYTWGTNAPAIDLGTVNASQPNVNFGIEQKPSADIKILSTTNSAFSAATNNGKKSNKDKKGGNSASSPKKIKGNSTALTGATILSLSGADAEDCSTTSSCNTGKTFMLNTINSNTSVLYDYGTGDSVLDDTTIIPNFDPANLSVVADNTPGNTFSTVGFTYSLMDAAGMPSPPVVYSIQTPTPLPILLTGFNGTVAGCGATLSWHVASETGGDYYELQQSSDADQFWTIARVPCRNSMGAVSYAAEASRIFSSSYFRLKRVTQSGDWDYSDVIRLSGRDCDRQMVTVAPNPAHFQVMVSGLRDTGATITLYSSLGALVYRAATTHDDETIDVSSYAPGTYLLQVTDNKGAILNTTRLVKK